MDGKSINACLQGMDFMKDWDTWRSTVKEAISAGKKFGMTDDQIKNAAVEVGDFLAEKVCPATKEEELIKEMWNKASSEERHSLASALLKAMA
jgi:sulfur relay (sulfurtransferase) DsrC/TusE family protein